MSATRLDARTERRAAGVLGTLGMALGVAADLASGYATGRSGEVVTPFSVLVVENLDPFLAAKPYDQVVAGHYLAVVGIPMGLFGLWSVYRGVRPAGGPLPRLAWLVGAWAFVVGTVFHASFAFVIGAIQAGVAGGPLLARYAAVFEPVGLLLVVAMGATLLVLGYLVGVGDTHYPRWFVLLNPLVLQAVTTGVALLAPEPVRVALIVTAYNLSVLVFFAVSTALLWDVDA